MMKMMIIIMMTTMDDYLAYTHACLAAFAGMVADEEMTNDYSISLTEVLLFL